MTNLPPPPPPDQPLSPTRTPVPPASPTWHAGGAAPPASGGPAPKRPRWKSPKTWAIGIAVILVLAAISSLTNPRPDASGASGAPSPAAIATDAPSVVASAATEPTATPTSEATDAPTVAPTEAPTAAPTEPPTVEPTPAPHEFATIEDGTWSVGDEIKPGTYRLREPASFCYWARLKGFGGGIGDIIANDNVNGWAVVTISKNDKGFESTGCGTWSKDLSQVTASKTVIEEGTLIVGTDLRPGTYRSGGGDTCYWARLKNFGGTLSGVIANGLTTSRTVVTIRSSDKGFKSTGCGDWVRR